MDGVTVIIIKDEELGVTCTRRYDESSGLIGEYFSCCGVFGAGCKAVVSFVVVGFR